MNRAGRRCLTAATVWIAALSAAFACSAAEPGPLNVKASYPEGPVLIGGTLYYAEMSAHRVVAWDGTERKTFFTQDGCGPTSISPISEGRLAVLCHLGDAVVILSKAGETLRVIREDGEGARLTLPNDSHSDRAGGVYFSSSGPFHPSAQPSGRLFHLAADGTVTKVAQGINYANGVYVTRDRVVYLSEHMGKKILRYRIEPDGGLTPLPPFADIAALDADVAAAPARVGPDGLEVTADGTVYVCIYGAGKIFKISADGTLLQTIDAKVRFVTNIALDLPARRMFVTGAHTNTVFPYEGLVRAIAIED